MLNPKIFSEIIGKITERLSRQEEKAISESVARFVEKNNNLNNITNNMNRAFYSFLTAKPFPNDLLRDKFYITFLGKHYNNNLRFSATEAVRLQEFTNFILGQENKEQVRKILTGLDSIRSIALGQKPPIYPEWQNKTLEEMAEELTQTIRNLNPTSRSFLGIYKKISDDIGGYLNIRNRMVQDYENAFVNKAQENLQDKFQILERVRNEISRLTGQEWKLWNMYMPHMEALGNVFDEKTLIDLADIFGIPGKKATALFTRKRSGSIFEVEQDPTFAISMMKFGLEYLKRMDELGQRTLRTADLIIKMDPETRKEFFNWIKEGSLISEQERKRYLELVGKPQLSPEEQSEFTSLQSKIQASMKMKFGVNKPISLSAFDNHPRLKQFFKKMIVDRNITSYLSEEPRVVLYDFNSFYGRNIKSQESKQRIAEIIMEEMGDIDTVQDFSLNDASRGLRRFFLVDEDSYKLLREIEDRYFSKKGDLNFNAIRDVVRFWKFFVTALTRFMPWRLANSLGDIIITIAQDPTTFKKLGEALQSSVDIIFKRQIPEKLKPLEQELISSGLIIPDVIPQIGSLKIFQNTFLNSIFGNFAQFLERLSSTAELTPKMASILTNLERIERGETPNFIGALSGIREMYRKGGDWSKLAITERGADISIDYSNIPPEFRKYFSDLIAPFAYWYVRSFSKIMDMFVSKDGFIRALSITALPFVAMYIWNTSDPQREKVWKSLPSWLKFHSIIAGFDVDEKTGKKTPIILRFYTAGDWVADILGFDNALQLAQRVQNGEITPTDAAKSYILGQPVNIARKFSGLLNPIIQSFIMMATNRDTFRGTKIVDDDIFNTPEGKKQVFMYAMNYAFLSPIVPAMTAGYSEAMDFLYQVYSKKDVDLVRDFLNEYLDRFFDPSRAFMIEPERVSYYISRGAQEEYYRLYNRQEEFFESLYQDIKRGNRESILQKLNAVEQGKVEGVTLQSIYRYLQRPSFKKRYIKEILLPQVKDDLLREQLNLIINYYQTTELLQKRSIKELKPAVMDYFEELNKIINGQE